MPERHLLPIPLPTGRSGTSGRLTIYFAHRLKEQGRLFPDYPELVDWPATLAGLNIAVRVNGAVMPHQVVGVQASSLVWTTAFARRTRCRAHRFVDYGGTPLVTMATSDFSEAVLDLYLALARRHPSFPPPGTELDPDSIPEVALLLDRTDDPGSLAEALAYTAPMPEGRHEDEARAPEWEFHEYVSLLGHHPELLRLLGLAVDVAVTLPPAAVPSEVSVQTDYRQQFGADAHEVRIVMKTTKDFLAHPNDEDGGKFTEQVDGFLDLARQEAFLSIVDPHLAAQRLEQVGATLPEGDGDLPALSTRALSLIRPDLLAAWHNRTARQRQIEDDVEAFLTAGGPPVRIYAEDVTIGQRVDVLDEGTWRSLFERHAADGYLFPRDPGLQHEPAPDEGWTTTTLVTEQLEDRGIPNPDTRDPIVPTALRRLDDALYRWDGWSGAAPPPGGAVAGDEVAAPDPNVPRPDEPVQVKVDYEVLPGTLPKLRFGRTYAMRARCVDLAGNSRPLAAPTPSGAAAPDEQFGRLEPVASPVVVRHEPRPDPGLGDTATTLVIRSELDQPAKEVAAVDRLLFPPRVGQDLCELHGLPVGGNDPASYAELAARDAVSLGDQAGTDPRTGEIVAAGPPRQDVKYLCDPSAVGVRFFLPEVGDDVLVGLRGVWPAREALRLELAAGPNGRLAEPDDSTALRVTLDQAEIIGGTVSFSLDPTFLDQHGLWQRFTPEEQDERRDMVLAGGHWMISAGRPVTFVHAVRIPLTAPKVVDLAPSRKLGRAALILDGQLDVHRKSTGEVRLTATWTEPVDDLGQDGPSERTTSVALGSLPVSRSDETTFDVAAFRSKLPDTKHHVAEVAVEAFSSFSLYFTERRDVTFTRGPIPLHADGVVASSVQVTVVGGTRLAAGSDYRVDGPRGQLIVLPASGVRPGTRLDVQYLPLPVSRRSAEHPEVFSMEVPNTVPPPPPLVHSLVPAFARSSQASETRLEARHSGRVVRVYLERPWLVSGPGELLGVVVATGRSDPATASWLGRDPVAEGDGPRRGLRAADLPRATTVVSSVDRRFDVAGHAVTYDGRQGRWFADIELPDVGYRPFARLVLARVQAVWVAGAALSTFVATEPLRLGVDRQIVLRADGDGFVVEVTGPDHDGIPDASTAAGDVLANRLRAVLQDVEPGIVDADLRWRDTATTVDLDHDPDGPGPIWTGRVAVAQDGSPQRILVEELEPSMRRGATGVEAGWNVIHLETFELPGSTD